MFLQNLYSLLLLLLLGSNFKLNPHPQFEEAYYRLVYNYKKVYYSCVVISTLTIIYCPTYINRKGFLTKKLSLLLFSTGREKNKKTCLNKIAIKINSIKVRKKIQGRYVFIYVI
jgi:hypothetical protein